MAKKKVEEMTAEQVATGTLENEVAEGANEKATAVEYNYPDIIREELIKTGRDGVLDLIEYMRECGFLKPLHLVETIYMKKVDWRHIQ